MIRFDLDHPSLRLGVVRAEGVTTAPSDASLLASMEREERALREDPARFSEPVRAAIRAVLRKGGYKPTGRGKPASEFLLGLALEGGLPRINNLVDINNLASLEHAHPISIFDARKLGGEVSVRFGRPAERYVFNASGQAMDIAGLPVICRGPDAEPIGNAVKDSMLCKVNEQTEDVLAVVYGTRDLPTPALEAVCARLEQLLRDHAGARSSASLLLP